MDLKSKNSMEVKKVNRNIIYKLIHNSSGISKQEIANTLNLSLPTVSQNLKYLKEQNLISEEGEFESSGGRKAKILKCVNDSKIAVGMDITKNHISMAIVDLVGNIINSKRISKKFVNEKKYFMEFNNILENFIDESKVDRQKILGVGISVPGILSSDKKYLMYSHALGLRNLDCSNFYDNICYPCVMSNDASAASIAETWHFEDSNNAVYISLSNTVGGAILINNHIFEGENQKSGEIGHMTLIPDGKECYCGKRGCVDSYTSALNLSKYGEGNLETFFKMIRENNEEAKDAWNLYLNYLAILINNIRMLCDCNIILGGYVGGNIDEDVVLDLEKRVRVRNTFENDYGFIKVCKYKKESSAVGSALIYIDSFINSI